MKVEAKAVRVIKRVMGDKAGGVLMEYVVLGLLVVAAVAGAVIMFGDGLSSTFDRFRSIIDGDTAKAQADAAATRANHATDAQKAKTHRDAMIQD